MRYVLLFALFFASGSVLADVQLPYACKVMSITGNTVMTPAGKPVLMMIYNLSEGELWITHLVTDPSAGAGWSSRLQTKHWSVLAPSSQPFELSCIESKPGHEQQVACAGVLRVCQWFNVPTTDKQPTPYWVGENMTLPELLSHLAQKGYQLPEAAKQSS
jgi:hypothetical protein